MIRVMRSGWPSPALTHMQRTSLLPYPESPAHLPRPHLLSEALLLLGQAQTSAATLFRACTTILKDEIEHQWASPLLRAQRAILHCEIDLRHPPPGTTLDSSLVLYREPSSLAGSHLLLVLLRGNHALLWRCMIV
jgi:hypothetical protein